MLTNQGREHEDGFCAQPKSDATSWDYRTSLRQKPRPVIQRFYSGSSVLVTGATGFMGKVLIEKLLRSCPDIECVYMMVREKKGRSLEERIDDLVSSPCFGRLKTERPDFRKQLRAVGGDIGLVNLGLGDQDIHLLQQQVSIVFHMAATVRFDEALKLAILQNVRGTREVLDLCRTFKKLKALIHVSTAYANCPQSHIAERFYEPHLPSEHVIYMAETSDVPTLQRLSHKLMGEWPNTYAYTKALSEDVVRNRGQGMPVGVFRPSIVVSTYKEPMEGWTDNLYGIAGAQAATNVGILRTQNVDKYMETNVVPCDMAINGAIASAWDVAENRSPSDTIPIYNYVTSKTNSLTWQRFINLYLIHGPVKGASIRAVWTMSLTLIANKRLYQIFRLLVHVLPALLVDAFLLATNRTPQMIKMYRKIHTQTNVTAYFATRQWVFESDNVDRMWACLHWRDRQTFPFDMDSLDWFRFVRDTCTALRVNIVNDPVETLPAALKKMKRLMIFDYALKIFLAVGIFIVICLVLNVRIGHD